MGYINANIDPEIPWVLSDIKPRELRTSDDPVIRELQREDALLWAKLGLATSKTDRCHRCGEYYSRPNPECSGASVHDTFESNYEEDDGGWIRRRIPCSYPGCSRLTSRDPIYDDLCYEHIRADNE